jgi:UMF1 family MFS transporter
VLVIFLVTTIAAALTPAKSAFWFIGPLIGIALAGIWTCERPLLVSLAPPEMYGTFFGVYSFAGKLAAILGPLQWGLLVSIGAAFGPWRYRIAIASLTIFFGAGLLFLRKIPQR